MSCTYSHFISVLKRIETNGKYKKRNYVLDSKDLSFSSSSGAFINQRQQNARIIKDEKGVFCGDVISETSSGRISTSDRRKCVRKIKSKNGESEVPGRVGKQKISNNCPESQWIA